MDRIDLPSYREFMLRSMEIDSIVSENRRRGERALVAGSDPMWGSGAANERPARECVAA